MKTNESRRKLIIITIIFILFQLPVSFAQNYNYENDVIINTSGTPSCNCNSSSQRLDPANNIPFSNSVVKIVMVDFNVFQDGSGGGNFQNTTNINSGTPRLYSILSYLNNYYSHNGTNFIPPANTTVTDLSNEFIQFELGDIYFYNNANYLKCSNASTLISVVDGDASRSPIETSNHIQVFLSQGW